MVLLQFQRRKSRWLSGNNLPTNAGDVCSIPGLGKIPGGGNDNPLQYSCLKKPHGQRSLTGYSPRGHKGSDTNEHFHTHNLIVDYFS